jgi:hypothetical protein
LGVHYWCPKCRDAKGLICDPDHRCDVCIEWPSARFADTPAREYSERLYVIKKKEAKLARSKSTTPSDSQGPRAGPGLESVDTLGSKLDSIMSSVSQAQHSPSRGRHPKRDTAREGRDKTPPPIGRWLEG